MKITFTSPAGLLEKAEAETDPASRPGGEEGVQDLRQPLLRNALAIIGDSNLQTVGFTVLGDDDSNEIRARAKAVLGDIQDVKRKISQRPPPSPSKLNSIPPVSLPLSR